MTPWTMFGWAATAGSLVSLSGALAWMRLRSGRPVDLERIESVDLDTSAFAIERYQPLERLLSEEDFSFLKGTPGYTAQIGDRWKRDQRRVVRLYLSELAGDFNRLHAAARAMVAESPLPSAFIVELLVGQKLTFWRTMASIELRLLLPGAVGSIHVRPLLQMLEAMRLEVERGAGAHVAG